MSFDNLELHDRVAQAQRIPKKESTTHIIPRFFDEQKRTNEMDANGLPVFRTIEFVELLIAGDRGNAPIKRVTEDIKRQFPNEYAQWKSKRVNPDMIGDGIPLSLWPLMPAEMAKALEYMNVFTVQQLAGLNDQAISKPGAIGLRDMREKAKAFLDSAKSAAPIAKLEKENTELRQRIELLQSQIDQLMKLAEEKRPSAVEPQSDPRQKRGRTQE